MNGIDSRIKIKLEKLYPNKKVENISNKDNNLYNEILKRRKEKNLSLKDYIESLGFKYQNVNVNTDYNIRAIKKLYREYEINMSELARIIGTSKQNLDQKLKIKNLNSTSLISDDFTNEEIELIINVINLLEHYYEDKSKNIIIRIYHHKKHTDKIAILYKDNIKIKYCFNLPEVLIKEIEKVEFNKYREQDIEILKLLTLNDGAIEIVDDEYEENDELTPIYINNNNLRNKIITRANKINLNLDDYANFLGYRMLNKRKYTDGYIKKLLEKYKLDNNIIKIPIESNDYIRIFRIAKTRGFKGLEEFVTTYGFKYERLIGTDDINEKYKNIIEQRYIVENKNIYINSSDPFYNRITSFSYKNGMVLDEYIKKLGFNRINNPNDLPRNCVLYDWKKDAIIKDIYSFDNITSFLDEIANENNEVYLDTSSQDYWNLWKIANIRNLSINDLIEMLGYKRIYAWDDHEIEKKHVTKEETEDEKSFIDKLLIDLEKIQGSLEEVINENIKTKRNQSLVKKVKRLYHNKCQLCCNDDSGFSVPPIEKENGELYVEVHHIKHISEASKSEDESNMMIDSYKNVIVVCSYHHKLLHYYHGGFKDIVQEDGQLYFKSKLGEKIKIYTNYHLTSTDK